MRLPDFFIIGSSRCGTNSLRATLENHPRIREAARREIHFFDKDGSYRKGLDHYASFFPNGDYLTFDTTPAYLYSSKALDRIKKDMPPWCHRFIVILRNPADRAWSHYWHWREKLNLQTFDSLIKEDSEILRKGRYAEHLKRWFDSFSRDSFAIIKSEDFFNDPTGIANRIIKDFLKLDKEITRAAYYDPKKPDPRKKRHTRNPIITRLGY